jgi:hypothetical protein
MLKILVTFFAKQAIPSSLPLKLVLPVRKYHLPPLILIVQLIHDVKLMSA